MKADQLVKMIREEVRKAVRDELADLLKEAVEIASRPEVQPLQETYTYEKPRSFPPKTPQKTVDPTERERLRRTFSDLNPINSIIEETKSRMTPDDYIEFGGQSDLGEMLERVPEFPVAASGQNPFAGILADTQKRMTPQDRVNFKSLS